MINSKSKNLIIELTGLKKPQKCLSILKDIHKIYLNHCAFNNEDFKNSRGYSKKTLFKEKLGEATLCICEIHFPCDHYTPLHSHPEFIVETILEGALQEILFEKQEGEFVPTEENILPQGHQESLYDLEGHPHQVKGLHSTSKVLLTTYGKNELNFLCESSEQEKLEAYAH